MSLPWGLTCWLPCRWTAVELRCPRENACRTYGASQAPVASCTVTNSPSGLLAIGERIKVLCRVLSSQNSGCNSGQYTLVGAFSLTQQCVEALPSNRKSIVGLVDIDDYPQSSTCRACVDSTEDRQVPLVPPLRCESRIYRKLNCTSIAVSKPTTLHETTKNSFKSLSIPTPKHSLWLPRTHKLPASPAPKLVRAVWSPCRPRQSS